MADVKENEMTIVDSIDYLRGLKAGDSVLITPEKLFDKLFIYRGRNNGIHSDNLLLGLYSMYESDTSTYNYPFQNGFIISFKFGDTGLYVQVAINPLNIVYIRSKWNSWSAWKQLH